MNETMELVVSSMVQRVINEATAKLTKPEDAPSTATIVNDQAHALALSPRVPARLWAWAQACEPASGRSVFTRAQGKPLLTHPLPRAHPLASLRRAVQKPRVE